ncbi:hypothetical protein R1sor_017318 [Riccia sorocarpa]|uniref:ATP-dependent RNA helicase n=1 Tax=Riccia sorocarpa TaxID=122646 RepID=A0ABD3IAH1_9MARC
MAVQRKGPEKFNKQHSKFKRKKKVDEAEEIELLEQRIAAGAPGPGTNPLAISLPKDTEGGTGGQIDVSRPYAGAKYFEQMPLSERTKKGLKESKYTHMTAIQRAALPHTLCGRDVLGAAKTGSGKTLAFLLPVVEKLYRLRWASEDGVGAIIISPTRELAFQIFDELKKVGKYHSLSAGLLIGGRKDVETEKEHVGRLNILVCTPGRLLQHMDETPDFDCSQLQILVLDEADRILDLGFSGTLNAIVAQLNRERQTLLFSATQTRSVQDLARLSLQDPEYLAVHAESTAATPARLQQTAMIIPLDEKMDMLWSFVKTHLRTKTLVFLSSCKEVKFVHEIFRRLRPGVPVSCLHGRMKQTQRTIVYGSYCEAKHAVLFCTDVAARGLDFPAVDWVVQVDCPEDVASYIHRVGRTARYTASGRSLLFLTPSEEAMLEDLKAAKIPVKVIKPNKEKVQSVTGAISALVSKNPELKYLGQKAFITYLRSIHLQKNKAIFDVKALPIAEYAVSLGLPTTPRVRFIKSGNEKKNRVKQKDSDVSEDEVSEEEGAEEEEEAPEEQDEEMEDQEETGTKEKSRDSVDPEAKVKVTKEKKSKLDRLFGRKNASVLSTAHEKLRLKDAEDEDEEEFLSKKRPRPENEEETIDPKVSVLVKNSGVKVLKKKKLKIDPGKAGSQRMVFDDEGNALPPLAAFATKDDGRKGVDEEVAQAAGEHFQRIKEEMRKRDQEDRLLEKQRLREKRFKNKMKLRAAAEESRDEGVQLAAANSDDDSDQEDESADERPTKKRGNGDVKHPEGPGGSGVSDSDEEKPTKQKSPFGKLTIAEQEDLALKLLQSRKSTF